MTRSDHKVKPIQAKSRMLYLKQLSQSVRKQHNACLSPIIVTARMKLKGETIKNAKLEQGIHVTPKGSKTNLQVFINIS